jgi:uncharacterized protein
VLKSVNFVTATKKLKVIKEHPADNKILECAIAANAGYVVSGDNHLLNVGNYKKTKILSAKEFLEAIKD